MPKAYDVKRNYYADLELPTNASCEDVKKQYRKLALQYHPDRNAGKEEEYIPKFQAIQAAHEILGEPSEKSKYDADRRKAGLYPTGGVGTSTGAATGARGNPYQATSAYPPPPRRTQPGTWQRTNTGADRFSSFPRGAPTAKKPDPTAERQNAFRAWQNMNNAQDRQQQQRYSQAGTQPQPKTASPRRPAPPPRAADPKFPSDEKIRAGFSYREAPQPTGSADNAEERQSAWAAFQKSHANVNSPGVKRSNTSKTPKKQGFDPNVLGPDEGPAPDSQYAHRHKSADFGRPSANPPPPPPRQPQPDSPMSTPSRPHADPLRPFKSRTSEDDAPYSEGNRVRTPYSSFSGERTDFGSDMRRSNSTRDTFRMSHGSNSSRARSTSPLRRSSAVPSGNGQNQANAQPQKPAFSVGGSSSTSSVSSEPDSADTPDQYQSPFSQPPKSAVPPINRPKIVPSPPSRRFNGSTNPTSPPPANGSGLADGGIQPKSNPNIFSYPTSPDLFGASANSKSRSEENINTSFSANGWSGTFSGSADYFAPPQGPQRRGSPSTRGAQRPGVRTANSTFGQPSSATQSPTNTSMPPPPRPYAAQADDNASAPQGAGSDAKFSKEQWEQTFKDASWTYPPPPSMPPPSSPAKGSTKGRQPSRKNSRAQSKPTSSGSGSGTAANPHVIDEKDDETIHPPRTGQSASAEPAQEADAMDIDNTPPATEQQPRAEHQKEPRLVSVPPSAWRQSQGPHASTIHHRATSSGSSNGGPLKTNLNDLANVAPFTQTTDGAGLSDLKSMSATLPFPSQAANTLPTNPHKPQTLSLPVVPIPPKSPPRLSKHTWHQYAQNFGVYLLAFNSFNSAMLQHFQARDQQAALRMQAGMAWLEAAGDATVGGGFGTFAREVKEDERVRETWNMGCERHADAVKEFDEVRERVRRLAVAGAIGEQ